MYTNSDTKAYKISYPCMHCNVISTCLPTFCLNIMPIMLEILPIILSKFHQLFFCVFKNTSQENTLALEIQV